MSRVERVGSLLRQIEQETCEAFDEHTELLNENRLLKAENAKLREKSSKYHDMYVHAITDAEVWNLQWSAEHQENDKLRELLSSYWKRVHSPAVPNVERDYLAEMRELGVEVD